MKNKKAVLKKQEKPEKPKKAENMFPIVAIGASAGGLDAVMELFKNLSPKTGMAYIYIQHLDPTHKSMLSQILSKTTSMKVQNAEHSIRIEPNNVYVMPADKDVVIVDGFLKLHPRPVKPEQHMPINKFFLSLAEKQNRRIIGIILSGSASDGVLGLKAIKAAGGFTIAQDDTAKFKSMPKSAIAEGAADLALPPAKIAHELELLSKDSGLLYKIMLDKDLQEDKDETDKNDEDDINKILQLLNKGTGVDFTHYKKNTIRRRIIRRMLLYKLPSLKDYIQYLKQHVNEINVLYQDLLINVTNFFRNPDTFEYIKKFAFPRILKNKTSNDTIRIWVPACSTGEEAYSLAIILMELLGDKGTQPSVQIFATDLSENAIAKARIGLYSKGDLAEVSPKRLSRFFTKEDDKFRIAKSIRNWCVFAPHNLFEDPPFSQLDLISCSNLMIYVDVTLQKKAMDTFHYALNNNGFLVLGANESPAAATNLFTPLDKKLKVFIRKRNILLKAPFATYRGNKTEKVKALPDNNIRKEAVRESTRNSSLEKVVDNLLLGHYVPASVVINNEFDILQFRGSTGLFLEPSPGRASLNLLKMVRPGLNLGLRHAVHNAVKSNETYKKTGLEFKYKNYTHRVDIEVVPLRSDNHEKFYLVMFEEVPLPLSATTSSSSSKRVKQLEQELTAAREDMRSIVEEQEAVNEELQSANEEIVSSNEELHSINEELETSKEELESVNEELLTVNHEMQVRNEQLAESNGYSETVLATIREATIVLDNDLHVKSANKAFYKMFHIKKEDAEGQLIYDLGGGQWNIPGLHELLEELIPDHTQYHSFQISHNFPEAGPKVLLFNAQKIIQKTLQQQVIFLAIEDITEHDRNTRITVEKEEWLRNIINNVPVMLWLADTEGKRIFFNKKWLEFTGRKMDDEQGSGWIEEMHPEDRERFLKTYKAALEKRTSFNIEYRLRHEDGKYRLMLGEGRPMYDTKGDFTGFTGTSLEVQERKK